MANEGYHEPIEELSDETRDMHRAITSLMEELVYQRAEIRQSTKRAIPKYHVAFSRKSAVR